MEPISTAKGVGGNGVAAAPGTSPQDSAGRAALLGQDFSESVINALPGSFFVLTLDGRMARWNRNFELLSEYSTQEIAAMHILDFVVNAQKELVAGAISKALEQGRVEVEVDCRSKSGRVVPFYVTGQRACVGGTSCLIGTGIDITERKRVEQSLSEERNLLRTLIDNIPDAIYVKDRESRFVLCNREVLQRKAVGSLEEIVGRSDFDFYPPELAQSVYANEQEVMRTGRPLTNIERCVIDKATGLPTWSLTTKVPLRNSTGEVVGLIGIGRDITQRKQVEKSLGELRDIVNRSPVLVFLWRVVPGQWPVEFVSENVERSLGYTVDDFLSGRVSWPGITHPDDVPRLEAEVAHYLEEGRRDWSQQYRLITKSGEIRWFTDQNLALPDPDGRITRIQSVVLDITERKRMEDALCESERKYRDLYEGSRDGTLAVNLAGKILHCNAIFLDMLGYSGEEIAQRTYQEITPPKWHAEESRIVREEVGTRGYSDVYEKEYIRRDGSIFPVEVRAYLSRDNAGQPVGMWALVRDITERKKAEAQVQQHLAELTRAWHANTLGEMASGLAHELNQPLCAILNYCGGCLRLTRKEQFSLEAVQASIEQIAAQAQRAADIIKRIRSLIARHEPHAGEADLESVLNDAIRMVASEASSCNVTILSRLGRDLPKVQGDSVEIEQVALNLMRNAMEAMSDVDVTRRTLTISSSRPDDRHVEVAVTDTGRGVAPELSEKIFESFFTSKPQGLGIGLSLSRRIVESHGGRLWVESGPGSGATFKFTLPVKGAAHGEGEPRGVHRG